MELFFNRFDVQPFLKEFHRTMRDVDTLFDSSLKYNIKDTGENYELVCQIPGFNKSQINIIRSDSTLTISGEKKQESNEESDYLVKEFSHCNFKRTIKLPYDAKDISTKSFENGMLYIVFNKSSNFQEKIEL